MAPGGGGYKFGDNWFFVVATFYVPLIWSFEADQR
jgi:hypothetical protein